MLSWGCVVVFYVLLNRLVSCRSGLERPFHTQPTADIPAVILTFYLTHAPQQIRPLQAKGDKYKTALKWGVPVITSHWLLRCAQHGYQPGTEDSYHPTSRLCTPLQPPPPPSPRVSRCNFDPGPPKRGDNDVRVTVSGLESVASTSAGDTGTSLDQGRSEWEGKKECQQGQVSRRAKHVAMEVEELSAAAVYSAPAVGTSTSTLSMTIPSQNPNLQLPSLQLPPLSPPPSWSQPSSVSGPFLTASGASSVGTGGERQGIGTTVDEHKNNENIIDNDQELPEIDRQGTTAHDSAARVPTVVAAALPEPEPEFQLAPPPGELEVQLRSMMAAGGGSGGRGGGGVGGVGGRGFTAPPSRRRLRLGAWSAPRSSSTVMRPSSTSFPSPSCIGEKRPATDGDHLAMAGIRNLRTKPGEFVAETSGLGLQSTSVGNHNSTAGTLTTSAQTNQLEGSPAGGDGGGGGGDGGGVTLTGNGAGLFPSGSTGGTTSTTPDPTTPPNATNPTKPNLDDDRNDDDKDEQCKKRSTTSESASLAVSSHQLVPLSRRQRQRVGGDNDDTDDATGVENIPQQGERGLQAAEATSAAQLSPRVRRKDGSDDVDGGGNYGEDGYRRISGFSDDGTTKARRCGGGCEDDPGSESRAGQAVLASVRDERDSVSGGRGGGDIDLRKIGWGTSSKRRGVLDLEGRENERKLLPLQQMLQKKDNNRRFLLRPHPGQDHHARSDHSQQRRNAGNGKRAFTVANSVSGDGSVRKGREGSVSSSSAARLRRDRSGARSGSFGSARGPPPLPPPARQHEDGIMMVEESQIVTYGEQYDPATGWLR